MVISLKQVLTKQSHILGRFYSISTNSQFFKLSELLFGLSLAQVCIFLGHPVFRQYVAENLMSEAHVFKTATV